jgi:hypothetical protein
MAGIAVWPAVLLHLGLTAWCFSFFTSKEGGAAGVKRFFPASCPVLARILIYEVYSPSPHEEVYGEFKHERH